MTKIVFCLTDWIFCQQTSSYVSISLAVDKTVLKNMKERVVSENPSNVKTSEATPEEIEIIKKNFSKLLTPFRMDVTHKDDDGNEGETTLTMQAETILGAMSCLERFASFREQGWRLILVQELFDVAEQEDSDMINSAEVDRRMTERLSSESPKVFREGVLSFKYTYSHPFLKDEQEGALTIKYRYNQILHLIQMINTVLTDKFSTELISGLKNDLDSENNSGKHQIKL